VLLYIFVVPVEFTDGRNIGVTEQELIGQLSFGWKETDNGQYLAHDVVFAYNLTG